MSFSDAERLIIKESGTLDDKQLNYMWPLHSDHGKTNQVTKKKENHFSLDTILVEGIPEHTSADHVKLAFEDARIQGGEVKKIGRIKQGHILTFSNASGKNILM